MLHINAPTALRLASSLNFSLQHQVSISITYNLAKARIIHWQAMITVHAPRSARAVASPSTVITLNEGRYLLRPKLLVGSLQSDIQSRLMSI
jgi:hypothetical protein